MKRPVVPGIFCLTIAALSEVGLGLVYLTAGEPVPCHLTSRGAGDGGPWRSTDAKPLYKVSGPAADCPDSREPPQSPQMLLR